MASNARFTQQEQRKPTSSPRPKGRDNAKDTLCRNVLIYGHCRYEETGCAFNHDPNRTLQAQSDSFKKVLNVDSPSFTPASLAVPAKLNAISQAVNATPFTPRGLGSGTTTPNSQLEPDVPVFNPAAINEFQPSGFALMQNFTANGAPTDNAGLDPFTLTAVAQALPQAQFNPYLEDTANLAASGQQFFQAQTTYSTPAQPLQYHLYAPIGPHREDLLAYQKLAHDFFIPNNLREELTKKNEAALQFMPNSQLPNFDQYHTLVPLDTTHQKSVQSFGLPSWVYKASLVKDGKLYCLRRLEGYRLTNEKAIQTVKAWRRVDNSGVVTVIDAFTTRAFGDSSLIFVTNYHPLSKTLVEQHFGQNQRFNHRTSSLIPEQVLWGYIVQIASAIKAIHSANLAVRCLEPSKVIITTKNRLRLSGCAILDVVHYEAARDLTELQQEDLILFGKLIAMLATNNISAGSALKLAVEQIGRNYSHELRDTVGWLLTPAQAPTTKSIAEFVTGISGHIINSYDTILHAEDLQTRLLSQELENGRVARLMIKLGMINERPEYEGDKAWAETGDRYMLKLFRDYVFHAVDAHGRPVTDLAHVLRCLNRLDAGTDDRIVLTSRDDASVMVVTYKEIKKMVGSAWADLGKTSGVNTGGVGRF